MIKYLNKYWSENMNLPISYLEERSIKFLGFFLFLFGFLGGFWWFVCLFVVYLGFFNVIFVFSLQQNVITLCSTLPQISGHDVMG